MKVSIFVILSILCWQFGFSQNYELIDKKVLNYPKFKDKNTLSIRIQNDFDSDLDRVRAVYTWIANNISYDLEAIYKPEIKVYHYRNQNEYKKQKNDYYEKKINNTWLTKKATCIDYSLLFKSLCMSLNIETKVIKGVTKVSPKDINQIRYTKDHAWNSVKLNGQWHLIDVTWSTGYEDESSKWVKSFNDFFFLTTPEYFLTSHYPDLNTWQLVENPISLNEFFSRPVFYASYFKNKVKLSNNQKGEIQVEKNRIIITFKDINAKTTLYYSLSGDVYLKTLRLKKIKKNTYQASIKYKQDLDTVLTLYIDNQAILDFKINASR